MDLWEPSFPSSRPPPQTPIEKVQLILLAAWQISLDLKEYKDLFSLMLM
jgi:hypothetical protein